MGEWKKRENCYGSILLNSSQREGVTKQIVMVLFFYNSSQREGVTTCMTIKKHKQLYFMITTITCQIGYVTRTGSLNMLTFKILNN